VESLKPQTIPVPMTLRAWLLSILSEATGHGSWTRVQGALTWAVCVALVAFSIASGSDIQPGAQTVLLALLAAAGGAYVVNRGGEVVETIRTPAPKQEEL